MWAHWAGHAQWLCLLCSEALQIQPSELVACGGVGQSGPLCPAWDMPGAVTGPIRDSCSPQSTCPHVTKGRNSHSLEELLQVREDPHFPLTLKILFFPSSDISEVRDVITHIMAVHLAGGEGTGGRM